MVAPGEPISVALGRDSVPGSVGGGGRMTTRTCHECGLPATDGAFCTFHGNEHREDLAAQAAMALVEFRKILNDPNATEVHKRRARAQEADAVALRQRMLGDAFVDRPIPIHPSIGDN